MVVTYVLLMRRLTATFLVQLTHFINCQGIWEQADRYMHCKATRCHT